jgi:hypothetical protein
VPSPASPPAELFRSLAQVLHETGASWYVFGAQAVLLWGRPRFTADIDVTVRLDTLAPVDFAASMERAGFALRVSADDDFVKGTRVLPRHPAGTTRQTRCRLDSRDTGPPGRSPWCQRSPDGARRRAAVGEEASLTQVVPASPPARLLASARAHRDKLREETVAHAAVTGEDPARLVEPADTEDVWQFTVDNWNAPACATLTMYAATPGCTGGCPPGIPGQSIGDARCRVECC